MSEVKRYCMDQTGCEIEVPAGVWVRADDYDAIKEKCERYKSAFYAWHDKTEWVQQTATSGELGRHRADVLRERIAALRAECERLRTCRDMEIAVGDNWKEKCQEAEDDRDALRAEAEALWSTYTALVDKLGIDTEKAKTADGKPSDVIVGYVEALRSQRDKMAQILRDLVPGCKWRFMRPRIDQALLEVDGGN